jgi:aconitate decarboxylase
VPDEATAPLYRKRVPPYYTHSMIATNVHTRKIAEFVSGLTYQQIPAEVRERIKLLILDSLGCAIYGANLEWCRILRGTLEALDATRTTSIWGTDRKLSSPHAALLNGTQVQGFSTTCTAKPCCMSAR